MGVAPIVWMTATEMAGKIRSKELSAREVLDAHLAQIEAVDITVTGHPAASVPAGFTPDGLPVGLQLVGRHLDDFGVLQFAHAFEQANPIGRQRLPL